MKIIPKLQLLGLNQKEAKIYLATLELGEASIQEISKQSGIGRVLIYSIIEKLISQGLINTVISGKKRQFIAISPKELEKIIEKKNEVLKETIPELESLSGIGAPDKPRVKVYEGLDGMKLIYQDILNTQKSFKAFTGVKRGHEALGEFVKEFVKERAKLRLFVKVIAPNDFFGQKQRREDIKVKRETRLIPKERFPFEMEANIYGNKVSFVAFRKGRLIGVILENHEIAKTMESIFDFAWECTEKSKSLSPRRRGAKNKG